MKVHPFLLSLTSMVSNPTRGQLERTLSQRIQAFYREQLEHQPGKICCCISDQQVTVIIEDSITQPEQLLVGIGKVELAEQVRSGLDQAIYPQLKELIEEIMKVPVIDLLSDVALETGRTGTIAILGKTPQYRETTSATKTKKSPSPA
jgi:uncharacterized protein YbcI